MQVNGNEMLAIKNKSDRPQNRSKDNSPRAKGLLQINEMSDEGANSANTSNRAESAQRSRRAG